MKIWPWSTISHLRQELREANERSKMFEHELYKCDPLWWTKKILDSYSTDPRMNCIINGIGGEVIND